MEATATPGGLARLRSWLDQGVALLSRGESTDWPKRADLYAFSEAWHRSMRAALASGGEPATHAPAVLDNLRAELGGSPDPVFISAVAQAVHRGLPTRAAELIAARADDGIQFGEGRWFAWGMREDLGVPNSTHPRRVATTDRDGREIVAAFDPSRRRVAVVGGEDGTPGHESLRMLGRVDAPSYDGLMYWVHVRGVIDPETGRDRIDEAVTRGYTAPSVMLRDSSPEAGGKTELWHASLLSEGEQRGTAGFPYLDEQGAGLSGSKITRGDLPESWSWPDSIPLTHPGSELRCRSAADWRREDHMEKDRETPAGDKRQRQEDEADTPEKNDTEGAITAAADAAAGAEAARQAATEGASAMGDISRQIADALAPLTEALAKLQGQVADMGGKVEAVSGEMDQMRSAAVAQEAETRKRSAAEVVDELVRARAVAPAERDKLIKSFADGFQPETLEALRAGLRVRSGPSEELEVVAGEDVIRVNTHAFGAPVSERSAAELAAIVGVLRARSGGKPVDLSSVTAAELRNAQAQLRG